MRVGIQAQQRKWKCTKSFSTTLIQTFEVVGLQFTQRTPKISSSEQVQIKTILDQISEIR